MKNLFRICSAVIFSILFLPALTTAQSGGQFAITQSTIANGGASSSGGNFGVTGTVAQTSVGTGLSGGVCAAVSGSHFSPPLLRWSLSQAEY